jgi:hypothetical protein
MIALIVYSETMWRFVMNLAIAIVTNQHPAVRKGSREILQNCYRKDPFQPKIHMLPVKYQLN